MRRIYYNISWGVGVSAGFITILHGGVFRDPQIVLHNIWTAPNEIFQNFQ